MNGQTFIGVDGHCDTLGLLVEHGGKLQEPTPQRHLDLPRLAAGGVDLQVFACCPALSDIQLAWGGHAGAASVMNMFDRFFTEAEGQSPVVRQVLTKGDLRELAAWAAAGKPADRPRVHGVLAIEGGEALEGDLSYLHNYFRLGLRLLTLTHNRRNALGDGVGEGETAGGLSLFGREVVQECRRLGIVVDVSHLSPAGFRDVIRLTHADGIPVVASHSNALALCRHPRNLTDDQAKAIAATGGLVAVTFAPAFLRQEGRPTLQDVLDHLEHFLQLLGPDHVGIGSDFDGIPSVPMGLEDASRRPAIIDGLKARGHNDQTIAKVMGENWMRVFQAVFPN